MTRTLTNRRFRMVDIRALMLTENDQSMPSDKCSTTLEGIRENGFSTTSNPAPSNVDPGIDSPADKAGYVQYSEIG